MGDLDPDSVAACGPDCAHALPPRCSSSASAWCRPSRAAPGRRRGTTRHRPATPSRSLSSFDAERRQLVSVRRCADQPIRRCYRKGAGTVEFADVGDHVDAGVGGGGGDQDLVDPGHEVPVDVQPTKLHQISNQHHRSRALGRRGGTWRSGSDAGGDGVERFDDGIGLIGGDHDHVVAEVAALLDASSTTARRRRGARPRSRIDR